MGDLPKRYFIPEKYLTLEVKAEHKSQYVAGEIYAMAGVEPWHIQIVDNITKALGAAFGDRPCQSYSTDMRVRSKAGELYTYPDVSALCGKPKYDFSMRPSTLLNPQVIFEVLSPSTEAFDRGNKFALYRNLDSLTDNVLVASESVRVEHFVRQENGTWNMTEYSQPAERLPLRTLECELTLAAIYRRVEFPSELLGD